MVNNRMKRANYLRPRLVALALLLMLSITSFAIEVDVPWDPGIYVGWNDLILEGILIRLIDESRPISICRGFLFRGQAGSVRVENVVFNRSDLVVTCDDTVSFFLRTASTSEPMDGVTWFLEDPSDSLDIPVGTKGYFAFNVIPNEVRPGWFFFIGETRQLEVNQFLASLSADSAGTVRDLKERHPGYRYKFTRDGD
jgi:hypothetical protein